MRWTNVTLIFLPRIILVEQNCLALNFLSLDFECKLRRILRKGDIDDITNELSQRALTKCDTNALLMAMEVGHERNKIFFYLLFVLVNSSLLIYFMCCSCFLRLIILLRTWYESLLLVLQFSSAVTWRLLHLSH